ncbi:polysaccharide pyruvyl transferase family protein [Sphingomonas sp. CFBP8993]|uniref:polysaccharide pyruvyl transferase family protein n=1 Tax=Sphingomonas sp. CFBP8993 TaxID=3096526 RepID=UPI002A6A59DE|nr:polysaccharide pyruvyl transferase family protein [Sphingomonas sp. CFBP8993]MDY0958558.1 polysaccharide pyruvyl transferase family protein [Sphingomonas sp. CFBP8993]
MSIDTIARQRAALTDLYRRHVRPGEPYALLDFPDHANVGDSAIWLGEIALLRDVGAGNPAYVSRWDDFDEAAFRAACPTGPILIHGGGNLGDIWLHHQRFREDLLIRFHDRMIVQLPQSIHFRDPANLSRFARIAGAHPDFHLYVRDRSSLLLAGHHLGCPVTLAPDSAFGLGALARPTGPDHPLLLLLRTDTERTDRDDTPLVEIPKAIAHDWLEEPPVTQRNPTARAQTRVERGLRLLSRGERVVTDRLHGHILSLLLGIPHVVLDNDYGKVGAYLTAWTRDDPCVAQAASSTEAAAMVAG